MEQPVTLLAVTGDETWQGREQPGVGIALFEAVCAPPEPYGDRETVLACVGMHAIARCYQRAPDRSDTRVLADLFALAHGGANAVAKGLGEFEIAAPSGGIWIGAVEPSGAIVWTYIRGRR